MPEYAGRTVGRHEEAAEAAAASFRPRPETLTPDRVLPIGSALPLDLGVRTGLEQYLGHDFGRVRAHADGEAAVLTGQRGARAYTVGEDVYFGRGEFAPGTERGQRLLAHELTHVLQQRVGALPAVPQCKEVGWSVSIHGPQDWTTDDRLNNTERWKTACLTNLNAVDSSQYTRVVERRDFYRWFYEYSISRGFTTRWALAAHLVAHGAHQIADMDVEHETANEMLDLAGVELQGAMREGNQVIFDNVLPKLKALLDGGPLSGRAALEWDMRILAEEQTLIQPLYDAMSPQSREQLNYIARKKRFAGVGADWTDEENVAAAPGRDAGIIPPFRGASMTSVRERWSYGMELGNQFTPGGSGYTSGADTMPAVSAGYHTGSEFAGVARFHTLHQLDAWLNPNRVTRMGPGNTSAAEYLLRLLRSLTPLERERLLADVSADGWAYSSELAKWSFATEQAVSAALPHDAAHAAAVAAFLARLRSARTRYQRANPDFRLPIPF